MPGKCVGGGSGPLGVWTGGGGGGRILCDTTLLTGGVARAVSLPPGRLANTITTPTTRNAMPLASAGTSQRGGERKAAFFRAG